jgi:hypothetical protein
VFLKRLKFPPAAIVLVTGGLAFGWQDYPSTAVSAPGSDRTLFPRNWLRGYGTFEYVPGGNGPDLGRCSTSAGQVGGANAPCADFARYMLSGYLEAQPFSRTLLRRVILFTAPRSSFGNNVPPVSHSYAFTPIAYEHLFGMGIELPKNFEFRVVHHAVHWMGRYTGHLGSADLGTTGPYGLYATLGVRWYFGGIHERQPPAPPDRTLFPRNWLRGYGTFEYAPSHNEPDLGRCIASTGQFGGANAPCADFARYMLSSYVEAQPVGRTPFRHVFLFTSPRSSFGNNVPQVSYTHAFTPIAYENLFGMGVELPRNFEFRVVHHAVYWMGRYTGYLGLADLGGTGPYGPYTTLGVRWHFGGIHESQ